MIAISNHIVKNNKLLLILGINCLSFSFYIIFSNVLAGIIYLLIRGKISTIKIFGLYCIKGESLVNVSEIALNEKLIWTYTITLLIKYSLLAYCIVLIYKVPRQSSYIIGAALFLNLFCIETFSLFFYYADKLFDFYFFRYFLTATPLYLFSKQLHLSLTFPLLHACLGVGLSILVLKKLNFYSPKNIMLSFAFLFLGIISVIMLSKIN